jgi:hypothetical protein
MLLTSSIRGHLLSLKFHPQMVTGIQHLQTPISSPMDQNYQKMHFQKVQNYTTSYKIKMRYDYTGRTHTCAIKKCRKSTCTCALYARLWTAKSHAHLPERRIYDVGRPPTHFWFNFQVDLTSKSRLNPSGWLVKDLKVP